MKITPLLLILLVLFTFGCINKPENIKTLSTKEYSKITLQNDTLFSIIYGHFEYGSPCGYMNQKGDTIINPGTFDMCFSDTFINFAYVYDKELFGPVMVAINRNKEVIFDAYLFDNGVDYLEEGLFRVKRNEKIGYADENGKIVIEPKYKCGFPFKKNKAKVCLNGHISHDDLEHSTCDSKNWFYIDKKGNRIK